MRKWVDNFSEVVTDFITKGKRLRIYKDAEEISNLRKELKQMRQEIRNTQDPDSPTKRISSPMNHGSVL